MQPKGKDFESLEQAKLENIATAKKLMNALELMKEAGEFWAFDFWRKLLFDVANANIRFLEAQDARIRELEAELSKVKGG